MPSYTKAHKEATQRYQREHYYRITATFPKIIENKIKDKADFYGSVNAYLQFLVLSDIDYLPGEPTNEPFEDAP